MTPAHASHIYMYASMKLMPNPTRRRVDGGTGRAKVLTHGNGHGGRSHPRPGLARVLHRKFGMELSLEMSNSTHRCGARCSVAPKNTLTRPCPPCYARHDGGCFATTNHQPRSAKMAGERQRVVKNYPVKHPLRARVGAHKVRQDALPALA